MTGVRTSISKLTKLKFSLLLTVELTLLYGHHCRLLEGYNLLKKWRRIDDTLRVDIRGRWTTVDFSFLPQAALCLQNASQLTCSYTSTSESIYKSSPAGIVTGGQPSLDHLQELISRVRELCPDPVKCPSPHFELQPKVVPLCRHIQNLLYHLTKIIQGQFVS